MVEVEDLFAEDEVLEQRRPARAGLEAVLIVRDADALVGRQMRVRVMRTPARNVLVRLAAGADRCRKISVFGHVYLLVVDLSGRTAAPIANDPVSPMKTLAGGA